MLDQKKVKSNKFSSAITNMIDVLSIEPRKASLSATTPSSPLKKT